MTTNNTALRHSLRLAARSFQSVLSGQILETALAPARSHIKRALVFELCYGAARHYFSLVESVSRQLRTESSRVDAEIWALLLISTYALHHTKLPAHAVVAESVHATRLLKKSSARGFVNAVLRRVKAPAQPPSYVVAFESPKWLIEELKKAYPTCWESILNRSNERGPLTLRIRRKKLTPAEYERLLKEAEVGFARGARAETLVLDEQRPAANVPGYASGLVAIQDASSQHAAHLLQLQSNQRVLDACSAPGVKALHMLDVCPEIRLDAIDPSTQRATWLVEETKRLGLQLQIQAADATNLDWWSGDPYDRILVDAPCSGTGTMRRHPDIKLHRTLDDVHATQKLQLQLLTNLWRVLAPRGHLLYCTCSLLPRENDDVIAQFRARQPGVLLEPLVLPEGSKTALGWQTLPESRGGDGFYFSLLSKA